MGLIAIIQVTLYYTFTVSIYQIYRILLQALLHLVRNVFFYWFICACAPGGCTLDCFWIRLLYMYCSPYLEQQFSTGLFLAQLVSFF